MFEQRVADHARCSHLGFHLGAVRLFGLGTRAQRA